MPVTYFIWRYALQVPYSIYLFSRLAQAVKGKRFAMTLNFAALGRFSG
jgi:hypothetical protein